MPTGTSAPSMMTRTYKSRYHHQLGRRPGAYSTRRTQNPLDQTVAQDKQWYSERLVLVPHSADDTEINTRKGQLVNVRGVKLRMWFQLRGEGSNLLKPLQIRWAILNPADNDGTDLTTGPANFFIDPNPTSTQAKDFPATSGAETRCFDFHNRKINRDEFGIVKEGSFVITNKNGLDNSNRFGQDILKSLNLYIPINKQMKWTNDVTPYPETNLYFCWWYTTMGETSTSQRYTGATAPLIMDGEFITYFTNSRMFVQMPSYGGKNPYSKKARWYAKYKRLSRRYGKKRAYYMCKKDFRGYAPFYPMGAF